MADLAEILGLRPAATMTHALVQGGLIFQDGKWYFTGVMRVPSTRDALRFIAVVADTKGVEPHGLDVKTHGQCDHAVANFAFLCESHDAAKKAFDTLALLISSAAKPLGGEKTAEPPAS